LLAIIWHYKECVDSPDYTHKTLLELRTVAYTCQRWVQCKIF